MADEAGVEVVGWDQVARAIGKVPDACERAAQAAAEDAAATLAATTRARVPKRSGRLASSVAATPAPTGAQVLFGAGVPYAGWIEYGGTRGRPYVPQGRYFGAGREDAATVYMERAQDNTDREISRLPWP